MSSSELGLESEDLFRTAKKALSPSQGERDRVRARLALKIGIAAAVTTAATTSTKAAASTGAGAGAGGAGGAVAAAKASSIPLIAKIVAPLMIAGAVGTATVAAPRVIESRRASTSTTAVSPVAAPLPNKTEKTDKTETTVPTEPAVSVSINDLPSAASAPSHKAAKHAAVVAAAPPPQDEVQAQAARDEEATLVAQLDAALRSGDMSRASSLADDHQRRFPSGLLVEEREGARVLVRCANTPNSSMAADFLRTHPRSPMRARILAACGTN